MSNRIGNVGSIQSSGAVISRAKKFSALRNSVELRPYFFIPSNERDLSFEYILDGPSQVPESMDSGP